MAKGIKKAPLTLQEDTRAKNSKILDSIIHNKLGVSLTELSRMSLGEIRNNVQDKLGKEFRIVSFFPLIGRGNVLSDRILSHSEVERLFNKAIR